MSSPLSAIVTSKLNQIIIIDIQSITYSNLSTVQFVQFVRMDRPCRRCFRNMRSRS